MDDTTCVINPQRNERDPRLPSVGILAVNPSDSSCFTALANRYALQKYFLFNSNLYAGPSFFLAGPAVGAPMAAICLEQLIAMGATRIILYGWCGSLASGLCIGDLFMPTLSSSEEGTSKHYHHPTAFCDDSLYHSLGNALSADGFQPKKGPIWTTDAVFRETRDKVAYYASQGVMAVDMEYAALQAVAAFRHVNFAAVMLVSDELFHQAWIPRFVQKSFRTDSKKMLDRLCALVQSKEVAAT